MRKQSKFTVTCLRSYSWKVTNLGFEPKQTAPRVYGLAEVCLSTNIISYCQHIFTGPQLWVVGEILKKVMKKTNLYL